MKVRVLVAGVALVGTMMASLASRMPHITQAGTVTPVYSVTILQADPLQGRSFRHWLYAGRFGPYRPQQHVLF